jgi:hypothetical protein
MARQQCNTTLVILNKTQLNTKRKVLITPQLSCASSMVDSWKTSLLVSTRSIEDFTGRRSDFMRAIAGKTIFMFTGHPFPFTRT